MKYHLEHMSEVIIFFIESKFGVPGRSSPDESELDHRAKTAPEKLRRKNWAAASIDLQTNRGEKLKVKAPGM